MAPEDFTDPEEILAQFDRVGRHPDDPVALRSALGSPPSILARCIAEGWLSKVGAWSVPVLTGSGKIKLRRWRTCWDCHQECIEGIHECPARRPTTPYRSMSSR